MPPKDEIPAPTNDNINPDDPWRRARAALEIHFKLSAEAGNVHNAPKPTITSLLTDLMHYCATQNIGKTKDNPNYLDFEALSKTAAKNFEVQHKALDSVTTKSAETYDARFWDEVLKGPKPILTVVPADPKLTKLLSDLADRQAKEADRLRDRQAKEAPNPLRHEQERDAQAKKFEQERDRYTREYNKGRDISEKMRADEKQKGLETEKGFQK